MVVIVAVAVCVYLCVHVALQRITSSVPPQTTLAHAALGQMGAAAVCLAGMYADRHHWLILLALAAVTYLILLSVLIAAWRTLAAETEE